MSPVSESPEDRWLPKVRLPLESSKYCYPHARDCCSVEASAYVCSRVSPLLSSIVSASCGHSANISQISTWRRKAGIGKIKVKRRTLKSPTLDMIAISRLFLEVKQEITESSLTNQKNFLLHSGLSITGSLQKPGLVLAFLRTD